MKKLTYPQQMNYWKLKFGWGISRPQPLNIKLTGGYSKLRGILQINNLISFGITITFILVSVLKLNAQHNWDDDDHQLSLTIPEMSLLSIVPANEVIKLEITLPERAGDEFNQTDGNNINSNTWINYSSTLKNKNGQKKLMVQVTSGSIPNGMAIELTAEETKTGKGRCGKPSTTIRLSDKQQTLISNIGGASTGKGKNYGHRLTYKLILVDINKLEFKEPDTFITVTYTISD
ncbi:MAG: hypothetical protein GC181_00200 [Bacteroidetes bacterium]|nr:hypothetical protein [Bacteroidota bacterium]